MKKSIVFIFGALLALGACTKTAEIPEGTSDSKALKFRLAVNTPTKGDVAYKGTTASDLNEIRVYASVRNDKGEVSQKSVFSDNSGTPSIPSAGYFHYNDPNWQLDDNSGHEFKYLPKGSLMDLVALGNYHSTFANNYLSSSASDYSTYEDALEHGFSYMMNRDWTPTVFEASKTIDEKVYFIGVDTYKNQHDVMYAVENGIAADGSTHTVTLKHAQALININIKVLDEIPDYIDNCTLAFIGANTPFSSTSYSDYSTMKDYMLGENTSNFLQGFMDAAESENRSKFDDYLPLKTVGSFLIDNSLNTPEVGWKFPKLSDADTWNNLKKYNDGLANNYKEGGYAVLSNKETSSDFNTTNPVDRTDPRDLINNSMNANKYYQAAGQLIPEQKIVNPWIWFTIDDKPYLTEVNLPKGVWKAGHVYTYNLTLSFKGPKFDVVVEDYASPFDVIYATL